jgi:hypothetical protein
MRHSLATAFVLIGMLFLVQPVLAQAPPPTPPADAMQAARELVIVSRATDRVRTLLPQLMQAIKPAIVQNRPAVERDYDITIGAVMDAALARIGDLTDAFAVIYARNFTAQELRDITAFYRTPTGVKLLEKTPVITQESLAAGQRFGQSIAGEMQKRMIEELRKKGHNI